MSTLRMAHWNPRKPRPRSLWHPPAGEPPFPRVQKKWRKAINAHRIAFNLIYEKETRLSKENSPKLEKLVMTRGASDFFYERPSTEAAHFVRAVLHLFGKNIEEARTYLYALKDAFPRKG